MKLSEITGEDLIFPNLEATTVSGILKEMAHGVCVAGKYSDEELLYERLMQRENQESTGIPGPNGLAIPHCKVENLHQLILAIGYGQPNGVDFKAIDGQRTKFFFLLISPSNESIPYLRALASLSRLLKSPTFVTQLLTRPAPNELLRLIQQEESLSLK
jgi:mannitol/fructose-specific phosphotransferase system IIA component (Ntr-type)